jgi:ribosome-binding factor A
MRTKGDGNNRPARLGERIREELMDLLLRGAVKDPGATGAIVHAVEVTGDLRVATVYVRLGEPNVDEARRRNVVRALARAAGFLRRELGPRLGVRHTPELRFMWDDTTERASRVEELLEEIREEDK